MIALMRKVIGIGVLAGAVALTSQPRAQTPPDTASYHLFFLGHDIGLETDTFTSSPSGRTLQAAFHFVDRGTAIDLSATLESNQDQSPRHLLVKGRNYRLFTSDSEVTIGGGQAHVRDGKVVSDVPLGRFFFPVDNYAPIGVQDALDQVLEPHGTPGGNRRRAVGSDSDQIARGGADGDWLQGSDAVRCEGPARQ